jgi:hypothetical protein
MEDDYVYMLAGVFLGTAGEDELDASPMARVVTTIAWCHTKN